MLPNLRMKSLQLCRQPFRAALACPLFFTLALPILQAQDDASISTDWVFTRDTTLNNDCYAKNGLSSPAASITIDNNVTLKLFLFSEEEGKIPGTVNVLGNITAGVGSVIHGVNNGDNNTQTINIAANGTDEEVTRTHQFGGGKISIDSPANSGSTTMVQFRGENSFLISHEGYAELSHAEILSIVPGVGTMKLENFYLTKGSTLSVGNSAGMELNKVSFDLRTYPMVDGQNEFAYDLYRLEVKETRAAQAAQWVLDIGDQIKGDTRGSGEAGLLSGEFKVIIENAQMAAFVADSFSQDVYIWLDVDEGDTVSYEGVELAQDMKITLEGGIYTLDSVAVGGGTYIDPLTGQEITTGLNQALFVIKAHSIPEPTTTTLTLLALCGLTSRRRRLT